MKFTLLSSLAAAALTTIVPQVSAFPALANLSPERMAELSQMARDFEAPNYVQKRASTVGKVTVGTKKLPDEGEYHALQVLPSLFSRNLPPLALRPPISSPWRRRPQRSLSR